MAVLRWRLFVNDGVISNEAVRQCGILQLVKNSRNLKRPTIFSEKVDSSRRTANLTLYEVCIKFLFCLS